MRTKNEVFVGFFLVFEMRKNMGKHEKNMRKT